MAQKKETEKQKDKRLFGVHKRFIKDLKLNHAGMYAIPNPMTKQINFMIMDLDDLENFNKQIQSNIQSKQEEENKTISDGMEEVMTGKGDELNKSKKTK